MSWNHRNRVINQLLAHGPGDMFESHEIKRHWRSAHLAVKSQNWQKACLLGHERTEVTPERPGDIENDLLSYPNAFCLSRSNNIKCYGINEHCSYIQQAKQSKRAMYLGSLQFK